MVTKMNKDILIAKNDFEGVASAIILHHLFNGQVEIKFYLYNEPIDKIETESCDMIYLLGLNKNNLTGEYDNITCLGSPEEVIDLAKATNPKLFKNSKLQEFCRHTIAYLDWSWKDKELYYGKNIDELSKYYNKAKLVETISKRIANKQELVTDVERQLIVFSKKLISDYIDKKNYNVTFLNGKKIIYTFSEINEIELANKLIEKEDADMIIIANLNNGIARIKAKKAKEFESVILNQDGRVHSNGGTIKIKSEVIDEINNIVFTDYLLKILTGGN